MTPPAPTLYGTPVAGPNACARCGFYRPDDDVANYGECRFHAPVVASGSTDALWPVVRDDERCGQFVRAVQARRLDATA